MIKEIESIIIEFILVYFLLLIAYYIILGRKNKKYDKNKPSLEVLYLSKIYNINFSEINYKNFFRVCMFSNCIIMDIIYLIISKLLKGFIWQMLIGFVLLLLLIVINYGLIGRYYSKKNENK